jgi:hypothetical protein
VYVAVVIDLEAELRHLAELPAADEFSLAAVVFIDWISDLDVVCEPAYGLRI